MTILHAFRRRNESIEVDFAGHLLKFAPNEAGDVVGEVPDDVADALVDATDGYRVYGEIEAIEPAADKPTKPTDPTEPEVKFILKSSDGQEVDLALMTEDEVKSFAAENGVKPGPRKGDKLRQFVVDALRTE